MTLSSAPSPDASMVARWAEHRHRPEGRALPVPAAQARADLDEIEAALLPADPRLVGRALDRIVQVLGVPKGASVDAWVEAVAEAFEDAEVPPDLVEVARKRAVTRLRFPPKPVELIDLIRDDLAQRKMAAIRIRAALMFAHHRGEAT